jgi:hypothetical protein
MKSEFCGSQVLSVLKFQISPAVDLFAMAQDFVHFFSLGGSSTPSNCVCKAKLFRGSKKMPEIIILSLSIN